MSKCCQCKCYNCGYDLMELDSLLYNLKKELIQLSDANLDYLYYKYKKSTSSDFIKISYYIWALKKIVNKFSLNREICLCPDEIGQIYSDAAATLKVVKNYYELEERRDVKVDLSSELLWTKNNPYCSSREDWERLSYVLCRELEVEITITELKCDFAFDLVKEEISCDVLTALSVAQKACDLNIDINRTDIQCKAEWKVFLEQYPGTIDLKTYKTALQTHKLTYEAIKAIYDSGLTLGLNKIGTCQINSKLTSYDLSDIKFNNLITSTSINSSNLISTSKETDIKRFLTDYNNNILTNACLQ